MLGVTRSGRSRADRRPGTLVTGREAASPAVGTSDAAAAAGFETVGVGRARRGVVAAAPPPDDDRVALPLAGDPGCPASEDDTEGESPSAASAAAVPAACGPASDNPTATAATPARVPRPTTDIWVPVFR